MADPIKYGWLPDKQYDAKTKRELYGWRTPNDFFVPNELARNHFANLGGRKDPYADYDEYWGGSIGERPKGAPPIKVPFDDEQGPYAKRYRQIFSRQPVPRRQPPQQPEQPPQGPKPMAMLDPWTQADNIRLQRVNQNLAQLASKVNQGELYPQEAEGPQQELLLERQQLTQRQQMAQQQAKGQARMDAMDEMAFQQAALMRNQQATAEQFNQMMPRFQDPDTGRTRYFKPQGFEPVDLGEDVSASDEISAALFGQGEPDGTA
jgi:hypothetical protein